MNDSGLIRAASLLIPVFLTLILWLWRRPTGYKATACILASFWNFTSLILVNLLAQSLGWWHFNAEGGMLWGLPIDILIGWNLLWGIIPFLAAPKLNIAILMGILLGIDFIVMPFLHPVVQLSSDWFYGDMIAVILCILPSQLLARWTDRQEHLGGRLILQLISFMGLMVGVIPAIAITYTISSLTEIFQSPAQLVISLQVLFLIGIPGLSAVQEFYERGKGTPFPGDPPKKLVTSGIYAYIANPMQFSMTLIYLVLGLILPNILLIGASIISIAYSISYGIWYEDNLFPERFGDSWSKYHRHVKRWFPRWKVPPAIPPAVLYYAADCDPCSEVALWFKGKSSGGLIFKDAETYPHGPLDRVTYVSADGQYEVRGLAALARSLEHIHLGWAYLGWFMRLPLIRPTVQLIIDTVGGGPRNAP